VWSGTDELERLWRAERRFEPAMSEDQRAQLMATWRRAVERARGWAA
jgi:glycerol kinase